MNITVTGLVLAGAVMAVGCAQTIARHDLVERSNVRIERAVETARRLCREQQPKEAQPSVPAYERCVLEELRRPESTAAKR